MAKNIISKKTKMGMSDVTLDIILTIIVTFVFIIVLYPMLYVVSGSFSSGTAITEGRVLLWPVEFTLEGYKWAFKNKLIWQGYTNSIFYTFGGVLVNLVATTLLAYPLSRRDYQAKRPIEIFLTISMMFGGGMIPTFIVVSNLGLYNNPLYMIIGGAVGISNVIMMRTYFDSNIPYELFESARMDGITDYGYLMKIVLPLSKAIYSCIALYSIVAKWNDYMGPLIYLREREYHPLALILNEMLNKLSFDTSEMSGGDTALQTQLLASMDTIRYSLIVVGVAPLLLVYPFVQKYFQKGVTMGSIKG